MVVYVYVYMGGVGRGSGWLVRAVERVSVVQLVGLIGQEQRAEGCNIFFGVIDKVLAWIPFSLLPTTKGQGRGGDATVIFVQRVVVVLD
jgi:hypothetical protein